MYVKLISLLILPLAGSELMKDQELRNKVMTERIDQIKSRYDNLTVQIQSKYDNLTKDNDRLQSKYDILTKDNDRLQSKSDNLTKDNEGLQSRYDNLKRRYCGQ